MTFLIFTKETYRFAYEVNADTPEQALAAISGDGGTEHIIDKDCGPAEVEVLSVQTMRKEAA